MTGIPFWMKIVGPIVLFALIVGGVMAWGKSKYNAGHKDGVTETDKLWQEASAALKADAAASATRADDAAVKRLEDEIANVKEDQEKLDAANENGTSPLDALFGT